MTTEIKEWLTNQWNTNNNFSNTKNEKKHQILVHLYKTDQAEYPLKDHEHNANE